MSMEPSANSMGGGFAGAVLPVNFEPFGGVGGYGEDESCEELKPDWELGSSPVIACRLAGGVLAPERREEW